MGLQDAATPVMEEIILFHDRVMLILVVIMAIVFWMMFRVMVIGRNNKYLSEGMLIEIVWTLVPAGMLVFVAYPSLKLLYLMDEAVNPALTIKAVAHQ